MTSRALWLALPFGLVLGACAADDPAPDSSAVLETARHDDGDIHKVKHVIVVMQENHSFDNYFGALAYAPGSPYHAPRNAGRHGRGDDGDGDRDDRSGCRSDDHDCVDGLSCTVDHAGVFHCANTNLDDDGSTVHAFHDANRCVKPDLDHGWAATHREANFDHPNDRHHSPMTGFVRVNDESEQHDNGTETASDDETMGFYNQDEIPFYYGLAKQLRDQRSVLRLRSRADVPQPLVPGRRDLVRSPDHQRHVPAARRLQADHRDDLRSARGQRCVVGRLLPGRAPGRRFRQFSATAIDPHFFPLPVFLAQAAGAPGVPELPTVSFVDPNFGIFGIAGENDEHPPTDIQRGQAFVSQVVNAVRNGPHWDDSVIFIVYDEHGGAYDHVAPPRAARPMPIAPGQCADLSNPPASLAPGGGAECHDNLTRRCHQRRGRDRAVPGVCRQPDRSVPARVRELRSGRRPRAVPGDLAVLEAPLRLARGRRPHVDPRVHRVGVPVGGHQHLTERDRHAHDLRDLFDFEHSPSRNAAVGQAAPPARRLHARAVTALTRRAAGPDLVKI